jgi:hypothetical protein
MNKRTSLSSSHHRLLIAGVCILVLSGFGFLYSVLTGDSTGLKAWLLPFGPWFCALLGYRILRQRRD